jgi:putative ABC transport system substrate-binding protein
MMKEILLVGAVILSLVAARPAQAQQAAKVPRIGYLTSALDRLNPNRDAFRQGLRDLGWVEGQNIQIEYRYAEGKNERLPDLAADLVRLKVDLILTTGGTATQAAKQATRLIPIVFTQVGALISRVSSRILHDRAETSPGSATLPRRSVEKDWSC